MSEQGWQGFLAAEGVADWVVLHGGAMAVFRVPSLVEAARLAEAVAQIRELDGALMTLTDRAVHRTVDARHVATGAAAREFARSRSGGGPGTRSYSRPHLARWRLPARRSTPDTI